MVLATSMTIPIKGVDKNTVLFTGVLAHAAAYFIGQATYLFRWTSVAQILRDYSGRNHHTCGGSYREPIGIIATPKAVL